MVYSSLYFKGMSSLLFSGEEVLWWQTWTWTWTWTAAMTKEWPAVWTCQGGMDPWFRTVSDQCIRAQTFCAGEAATAVLRLLHSWFLHLVLLLFWVSISIRSNLYLSWFLALTSTFLPSTLSPVKWKYNLHVKLFNDAPSNESMSTSSPKLMTSLV